MSFIAVAGATEENAIIKNGNFWPDINLSKVRDTVRLDGTVTDDRLKHAAVAAIIDVNRDLKVFKEGKQKAGYTALADVPAEHVDEVSELVSLYLRAVYCRLKANLMERYADYDSTAKGLSNASEQNETITDLYRDARFAIRDILGVSHVTVELI